MGRGWSMVIGIACLLGAAYLGKQSIEFRRHGEVVIGTVLSVDAKLSTDKEGVDYSERAIVNYTPKAGGGPFTLKTGWATAWFSSTKPGDPVSVRYLPENPEEAREDSLFLDWAGPLALLVFGIAGIAGKLQEGGRETVWWRSGTDD
ncbi:MAG: DUF3592 domain-containing protein [Pseudomarimonas sp.]